MLDTSSYLHPPSRQTSLWAYLQLLRPANIVTAWADILAGAAIALGIAGTPLDQMVLPPGGSLGGSVAWLLLATTGLYAGGVALNDVVDAELDAQERPERPIPRGQIARRRAGMLAIGLLLLGIGAACQVSWLSGGVALGVASLAVIYDAIAKSSAWFGPLVMGLCRAGNLLLGISLLRVLSRLNDLSLDDRLLHGLDSVSRVQSWWLSLHLPVLYPWPYLSILCLPLVYIGAITLVSQGEVQNARRRNGVGALVMMLGVFVGVVAIAVHRGQALAVLPVVGLLIVRVVPPFWQTVVEPSPRAAGMAVRAGVVSLIVLDGAIAAGFVGWVGGGLILLLLPLSMGLARLFAVT